MKTKSMQKIVALCNNRGFIFKGSEIFGGLANSWDYGPTGVELKNNVKKAWWKAFVQESSFNVGLDTAIIMNPAVWKASGHLDSFTDPLMDCKGCNTRHRADKLIDDWFTENGESSKNADGWTNEQMTAFIIEHNICCPSCGGHDFTDIRQFNLMFRTFGGVTENAKSTLYLRPETAQGIFVNFKNVIRSSRISKMPFGIAQIGKSFRNEITPGNFTFRTREFEQMELEFFCEQETDLEWFDYWRTFCFEWLLKHGISKDNLRLRDHSPEELSFYSKATTDIEYNFPFGFGELWGIADRTDYDLKQHSKFSGQDLSFYDAEKNVRYTPFCIEPSLGADRVTLAFICEAYDEEKLSDTDTRIVMRFHPSIAPVKAAILPLSKKLSESASEIYRNLSKSFFCEYDDSGSIGKRYRRQDEIGTPFCITVDYETANDKKVTVRERDSMKQERIFITELEQYISKRIQ
jgi:glycyl-tRNA synthetase